MQISGGKRENMAEGANSSYRRVRRGTNHSQPGQNLENRILTSIGARWNEHQLDNLGAWIIAFNAPVRSNLSCLEGSSFLPQESLSRV